MAQQSRFQNIQALRFFAALVVAFAHVDLPRYASVGVPADLFGAGAFGVDVFFVISGFIMMHVSAGRGGPAEAWRFLLRRILRVWPLYAVFTAFAVWLAYEGNWHNWLMGYYPPEKKSLWWIAESITFTHWNRLPVYAIGWTLIYEFWFYCSVALCIFLRTRPLVFFLVSATLIIAADGFGLGGAVNVWANPLMLEFLFGVALFHLYQRGWLPTSRASLAGAFIVGAALLWEYEAIGTLAGIASGRSISLGLAAFFVVAGTLMMERRFTAPQILIFLGDASFSLYLTHWLVMTTLPSLLDLQGWGAMGPVEYVSLHITLSLVLSIAVFFVVERPLRWMTGWLLDARRTVRVETTGVA